jgi:sulfur carrier protein
LDRRAHGKISLLIALTINGERRDFEGPLTAAELIERLQLGGKRVALERNGQIVPRGTFLHERLADGDRLEIVVAVGGG